MAIPGFYAGNALISYPLVPDPRPTMVFPGGESPVPPGTLVEFLATIEPEGGYVASIHFVRLVSISREDDVVTFVFKSDAPGLITTALRFQASTSDLEWTTITADGTLPDGSPAPAGECGVHAAWSGTIVIGPLDSLLAILPNGASATGNCRVEPCLVKSRAGRFVRAVSIGNVDRTRFTTDEVVPDPAVIVAKTCITGDVRFAPGYNMAIRRNTDEGTLEFSAVVGAGDGQPCSEIPLYVGETAAPGSRYLSGGPACRDAITSISGTEGAEIKVVGRSGVAVGVDPESPHRLVVRPDAVGAAGCPAED